jgi:hypothetical protein
MFISDPGVMGLKHRIPDPDPEHASASKNLSILTPTKFSKLSNISSGMFIPDPDPGVRDQNGTGSRIRIQNTG